MDKKLEKLIEKKNLSKGEINALIDQIKNPDVRPKSFKHNWGRKHFRIGLLSDTHVGSKYVDFSVLNDLFKRFKKEEVDAIYLAGDITEGYNMRPGHSFECDLHGADAQARGAIKMIPFINKPIYFVTGDHDYSHFKRQGIDIGKMIEKEREDINYLGQFSATINFSKNANIMITHPAKGTAYALSYHPQKMIEAFSGGEKPKILAIGHYHKIEQLYYRNVHCFQTGCIQDQTDWMKRMNLSAHKGGWVLDVFMKKDGTIDKLESKLFPYYE